MFACLYRPPAPERLRPCQAEDMRIRGEPSASVRAGGGAPAPVQDVPLLVAIAQEFSPRYEVHREDLVSIDVRGLERLFLGRSVPDMPERTACGSSGREAARALGVGPHASEKRGAPRVWNTIAEELRREAAARGVRVHVALAGTRMAALVLAIARPGLTIVERGGEAEALAPLPIGLLEKIDEGRQPQSIQRSQRDADRKDSVCSVVSVVKHWGLKTLGELAALPRAALSARLGPAALVHHAIARGEEVRPLIPTLAEERFDTWLELEWPIDGLEPLSFVLTRLLEPLSIRLERRDRGVAVLHVELRLVTREIYARHLELPTPMRDVRALRTLALLDLESHPPPAAIDRVAVIVDPTPGRVVQHTLFTRAHPTPEQVSTLLARLGALMGQDRLGTAATLDSYRPGAFEMKPFATDQDADLRRSVLNTPERHSARASARGGGAPREVKNVGHIVTNQLDSEMSLTCALRRCRQPVPARVAVAAGRPMRVTSDRHGFAGGAVVHCAGPWRTSGDWWSARPRPFNRDEWDVALTDGAVYRIFRDRDADAWFFDAIVD